MATIKAVLRKKIFSDGTYPLAIRVTVNRTSTYTGTGQRLRVSEWDEAKQRVKKSHPNSSRLNNLILKKIAEVNGKLIDLESHNETISTSLVRKSMKPKINEGFFSLADSYLNNFKVAGKYNRVNPDGSRIKCFREFCNNKEISFQEITIPFLQRFKAWLQGERKASERTIVNHLIVIRTVFNIALKENMGLDRKHYPFGKDKIQIRIPESIKIGLESDEVRMLEQTKIKKNPKLNHAKNLWLFSFYFAGMRVSDVLRLRWSDFVDQRLIYKMGKNSKPISLKVPERALKIISEYKSMKRRDTDLVFPELKNVDFDDNYDVGRKIANAVKVIDERLEKVADLAGIKKPLTMHIARHTFGNISGDRISPIMLQKLYRHSSITTTIGYQANFIHKDADEALNSVLAF